ncbi:MAG: RNA polymerase sigma factor [Flavisolibacter sp.]
MDGSQIHNENALLQRVANGDEAAFSSLFHQYWDNIYGVALMLTKSAAIAEDMVQEIFVKVWLKRSLLPEVENFQNFLFIVARNHIFDELRKRSREQDFVNHLIAYFKSDPGNPELDLLHKESGRLLQAAVSKLPEQQRQVYVLSREQGLSQDQIAAQLGISRNTVRNHMARALQSLREFLTRHASGLLLIVCLVDAYLPS